MDILKPARNAIREDRSAAVLAAVGALLFGGAGLDAALSGIMTDQENYQVPAQTVTLRPVPSQQSEISLDTGYPQPKYSVASFLLPNPKSR